MWLIKWIKKLFTRREDVIDYTKPSAFVHTWSVVDFARKHGKMQLGKFPSFNNRETFQVCRFVDSKNVITYVNVSSVLQGVTSEEISDQKDRIRVGELSNGKFVLYDFRWKDWENVELGL